MLLLTRFALLALTMLCLLSLSSLSVFVSSSQNPMVSIRGHPKPQALPKAMTKTWSTWTYNTASTPKCLTAVEGPFTGDGEEEGWVDPSTFDELHAPSDLALPEWKPALGLAVINGSPRYIFPSVILSLSTKTREWRNRGLCSLPRADTWIDTFAAYTPDLKFVKSSYFGKDEKEGEWYTLHAEQVDIKGLVSDFQRSLYEDEALAPLRSGYHFVDIPLGTAPEQPVSRIPRQHMRAILTDFDQPEQWLAIEGEDPSMLDGEPCGMLSFQVQEIAPGGASEFLPEVYRELFVKEEEEGGGGEGEGEGEGII